MATTRYTRGLVPLSADPVTKGHVHLVKKALQVADEVVVFVGQNDSKRGTYLFDLNKRTRMVRRALNHAGLSDVKVVAGDSLLVGVYLREACDVIIRGIRNTEDRRYEERQMGLHKLIHPAAQVEYLEGEEGYNQVSSTMVKAFTDHAVDTSPYVNIAVKRELEVAIKEQWLIGVTGAIATGKSWVVDKLVERCIERGIPATAIKVDNLQREIYAAQTPAGAALRESLRSLLGPEILTPNGNDVNRPQMMALLSDPSFPETTRKTLHKMVEPLVLQAIREARNGTRWHSSVITGVSMASRQPPGGLVIIEWAQMAEMDLSHWVNHNVIVVDTTSKARREFFKNRNLDPKILDGITRLQWDAETKANAIAEAAERDGWGDVLLYDNDPEQDMVDELIDGVRDMLPDLKDWPRHRRREYI